MTFDYIVSHRQVLDFAPEPGMYKKKYTDYQKYRYFYGSRENFFRGFEKSVTDFFPATPPLKKRIFVIKKSYPQANSLQFNDLQKYILYTFLLPISIVAFPDEHTSFYRNATKHITQES